MSTHRARAFVVAVLSSCLAQAFAQQPAPAPTVLPFSPAAIALGSGEPSLQRSEQQLWGFGNAYKVRFDANGIDYTAAFGPSAPRDATLGYELQAIGRGDRLAPVGAATQQCGPLRVDYVRRELIERYDLRADSVEQSFVLTTLPPGTGDLVLRGALATELQLEPWRGGLRCAMPGIGSFELGAVTAIDAAGQRATAAVTWHDGVVDYTVPAAFVERAQLPLTVDPFIGSNLQIAQGTSYDQDPDVAFDVTNAVYLVVYELVFSATDTDIYSQRVATNGTLVGTRNGVNLSVANDINPQVANVNLRDRFVVVWNRVSGTDSDVYAVSVDAATGLAGSLIAVAAGTGVQDSIDVSGEATLADQDAICVWRDTSTTSIEAAQLSVNPDGSLFFQDRTTIVTGNVLAPRIDKSGGTTGRHLIVWQQDFGSNDLDPHGRVVDRELTFLSNDTTFDAGVNFTTGVDVDGDGTAWLVAWQVKEAATAQHDIVARACHLRPPGVLVPGTAITPIANQAATDETEPSVCWLGQSVLVGYSQAALTSSFSYVASVDALACTSCEGQVRLVASLTGDHALVGASRRSGGDPVEEALLAVESRPSTDSNIVGRIWQGGAGLVATVAASCGGEVGHTYASCAMGGNANFAVRCVGAAPNAAAVLVGSRAQGLIPCGGCRFVPDPWSGFAVFTTTDSAGMTQFAVGIPANTLLVGLDMHLQWLIADPVTPGCYLFGSDLSDAIRVTLQ